MAVAGMIDGDERRAPEEENAYRIVPIGFHFSIKCFEAL